MSVYVLSLCTSDLIIIYVRIDVSLTTIRTDGVGWSGVKRDASVSYMCWYSCGRRLANQGSGCLR